MFIAIANAIRGAVSTLSGSIASGYSARVLADGGYIEGYDCMLNKLSSL